MRNSREARSSRWGSVAATAILAAALWLSPHLARAAGWPEPSAAPAQNLAARRQPAASASDAAEGEALFLGRKPLENGGPPCKTCHGISNLSVSHGPTPGPNLTNEYSNFGPEAIDKYLQQPPVRPMSILFKQSPITPDERRQLVAFLRREDRANPFFMPPPPPAPEVIAAGKALFTGRARLQNGGPACIACHTVAGIPFPHGGTMGPDLTREYANLGPLGVTVALRTLDFPAMTSLYQKRPLTAAEQQQFAAFFRSIYRRRLPASPTLAMALAAIAVVAALFLWALLAGGRRRARRVRQQSLAESGSRKGNRGSGIP
jgi:mono/diheme cytochrome c family protein